MTWRIHREWGAVRLELGRLWLIRCAPLRPGSPGHPNKWMIVWRRGMLEFNPRTAGQWKTSATRKAVFNSKLTEAERRDDLERGRADEDEPERVRLLQAYVPLACFQCNHPNAPEARKQSVEIIRAIRHHESVRRGPAACCADRMARVGE